jgi:energy-coupling factor transporter ATP-binding protein EcfA2
MLADLQVHTPSDPAQRYGAKSEPNEAFAEELIRAHADAGVGIVAITDHNRVDWWPLVAEAGRRHGVFVFPGIEVNVNKCHLLMIWERSDDGYQLAQNFLGRLFPAGAKRFSGGSPCPTASGSTYDIAELAVSERALVFAPHSTASTIGLFGRDVCNTSSQLAQSGLISGFDVFGNKGAEVLKNPRGEFADRPPAWFISGDVRALGDVGRRAVFLKVDSKPTLESLRQAFLMPGTRVRFPQALLSEWGHVRHIQFMDSPTPSWPHISRIQVAGGFHDQLDVTLGPGLNAVIGGKGTGKSTLVEVLRYVLEAPASIAAQTAARESQGNLDANFKANAEADVHYSDGNDDYVVHRVGGGGTRARLHRGAEELEIDVSRRVAVRVFGQRELAELHRQPTALRDFVSRQTGNDGRDAEEAVHTALRAVRDQSDVIAKLEGSVSRNEEASEQLADLSDRLTQLAEKGAEGLVNESRSLGELAVAIRSVGSWPDRLGAALEPVDALIPAPSIPQHPLVPEGLTAAVTAGAVAVGEAITALHTAVAEFRADVGDRARRWLEAEPTLRQQLDRRLADAGLANPSELGQLQQRVTTLTQQLASAPEQEKALHRATKARDAAMQRLESARRKRSRLIERAATDLNDRTKARVRLHVLPLADREHLQDFFAAHVLGRRLSVDQANRLARLTPSAVAEAARTNKTALTTLGLTSAMADRLVALEPPRLRELEEVETADLIQVQVDLGTTDDPRWTDIGSVSPGQAATAMLSLALVSGDEPIVIDQPEDDLDNRFIYDEVVQLLAEVASRRQVIVATHNANIPVLGDAELILALDAVEGRGVQLACGGLDDTRVAEMARHILEGGDDAFRARARRYSAAPV